MTPAARAADFEQPPLALTLGEPAGVGGEITLKAWRRCAEGGPVFFAIDHPPRLERLGESTGLAVPLTPIDDPQQAAAVFPTALPVLARPLATEPVPGEPDPANGPAVIAAIETAVALAGAGRAGAVVTNPIHKASLYEAGFGFPGHTEFLAHLAGTGGLPVMMLASPLLRVVPVTVHLGLADAIAGLNADLIVKTAEIVAAGLDRDFAIARPRLAIAGLNPHAGEGGAMGSEEAEIIAPAVERLCQAGIEARGPLPPDTLFHAAARKDYDAVLCMYHDQALIPIKALDFDGAVNVTLGLPFVRTSPDHGTALDIAGTGTASEASLVAALSMAADMARRRAAAAG
ncbi:MAG: 4-hydroxythreonine-4-phosphate dehydrogenase PdxA [Rhodospirillales bacterium]|jgi:4-hydroxythreonine-4-phosphate dehydrogenase|nr:4-hydroxythreonine-4-phosphate dehydrogenase PdxA [Rhodospirillales bacterium]MDP6884110.1 4-hydroxythreonine-4-phosphate dehydrogenase PdxA [Rhodospirillales bacterium]